MLSFLPVSLLPASFLSALLMSAAMFGYVFNDAMIKILLAEMPIFQAIFLRGLIALPLIIITAAMIGHLKRRMGGRDWLIALARAGLESLCTFWFMKAITVLSLGSVTAILQAIPITVTLGAALFLGEKVGWRRWLAILIGFIGVLIIIQPGGDSFSPFAIYAILVVLASSARDLLTRKLSPEAPALQVTAVTAALILIMGASQYDAASWIAVSGWNWFILSLAGLAISLAYLMMVMVMRLGEVSLAAPWRYTAIVWAVFLGFVILGEWPANHMLAGVAIVVLAGLFTLWRERVRNSE